MRNKRPLRDYFKTEYRLTVAIENQNQIEGMKEYLDDNFFYQFELETHTHEDDLFKMPYWIDHLDYNDNIPDTTIDDIDFDDCIVQYMNGHHEPHNYGDTLENGYTYVDSASLPEEVEHQTDDNKFVYEYRDHSFLRILWKKEKN